jgi:hypothetical protein
MVAGTDRRISDDAMSTSQAGAFDWRRVMRRQCVQALVWGAYFGLILLQFNALGGWHSGLLLIALILGAGLWSGSELLRALALRYGWLRHGLAALAWRGASRLPCCWWRARFRH